MRALAVSRAHHLLAPISGGLGAILMLHRVEDRERDEFDPNGMLSIRPEFLAKVLERLRAADIDIVPMDEVSARIREPNGHRFAAITIDDGYCDTRDNAYPVLKAFDAPFTVYVATDFADGNGELWWVALEDIVRTQNRIEVKIGDETLSFDTVSPRDKVRCCTMIYWYIRSLPEEKLREFIRALCERYGHDMRATCRTLCMDWSAIRALAADPLVTIGAHTLCHPRLAHVGAEEAERQMRLSRERIAAELGREVRHFAYPIGDSSSAGPRDFRLAEQIGFETAVTTRHGMVFAEHDAHLTALPRLSLNGHYQDERFIDVLLSGAPFALFNGFRRVNAA